MLALSVSERRACRVAGLARTTQRHRPRIRPDEARLVARIIELATQYGRYGDRRSEFTAKAVRKWLGGLGVETLFIDPGSPWENG